MRTSELDHAVHPDIRAMSDVDEVIGAMVMSCGCLTKTPEPRYHDVACRYRHLAARLEELDDARAKASS